MSHSLDDHFRRSVSSQNAVWPRADGAFWWEVFEAQATSRQLDFVARELQRRGEGFYTIGSAGHESNALIALATRPSDPALLHYRSGGFYLARAAQVPGSTPVRDILQGLMTLADEPIAGGRHKVFGHHELGVIPQTSTIASHLPRAVGLAMSLHRAYRLGAACPWPEDSVIICSFGDASANHSTAVGAINTALNAAFRRLPVPLLFVCEDNGLGISVPTPPGWIENTYDGRPGLDYVAVDGAEPAHASVAITEAVRRVREQRRPGLLHLRTVRFLGHAGSDAEISYRRPRDVEADYERDPLLATARQLLRAGATSDEIIGRYDEIRAAIDDEVKTLIGQPRLESAAEVMVPIGRHRPDQVRRTVETLRSSRKISEPARDAAQIPDAKTLAESINSTLGRLLDADHRVIIFGEDVGVKGGVYGVTGGLARRHGSARVFDTVLDEQAILGLALGAGLTGLIPIPEIQYLAYLHNAEDQLRGEGATLPFFSQGRFTNPMVVRLAGLAYQKGFGGHFHNDNAVAVLRDIPGLVVACPARADDAAAMLTACVAAAVADGTVSVFLEPIALYHRRDLHQPGDNAWLAVDHGEHVPIGGARTYSAADGRPDIVIISFGNGIPMSLRVASRLAPGDHGDHGGRPGERAISIDVVDLRWLAPLPVEAILVAARRVGRVLVVDETRHTGGVGEAVITALVEGDFAGPIARVSSQDSFIPLGDATQHVLLGEDDIETAAIALAARGERS